MHEHGFNAKTQRRKDAGSSVDVMHEHGFNAKTVQVVTLMLCMSTVLTQRRKGAKPSASLEKKGIISG